MSFPTVPTVAANTLLTSVQNTATTTHTFGSLTTLDNAAGDLLLAVIVTYDGNSTNAEFSTWGGGFTEFVDQATTTTVGIGAAYKFSDGTETGTFTVTSAGSTQSAMFLMSIKGAHGSTVPEGGTIANGTAAAADPGSFNPTNWVSEDTLWISVAGNGEDSLTGSFTGYTAAPTSYANLVTTTLQDATGHIHAGVAFRQTNTPAEDVGTATVDLSNARNSALLLAVRPNYPFTPAVVFVPMVAP